ncbi:MAG: hypothetical protein IPK19_13775 [Chloroflexi bacterium]|nr:hypothetical protein [Chloroflexota bacterium]
MNRRRDPQDDFDPFDDPLDDGSPFGGSPMDRDRERDDGELDILDSFDDDNTDLIAEIERPRRRGAPRDGGGIDLGAAIGGLISAAFTGLLLAAFFLVIGAVAVVGARALGVLEGGPVNFTLGGATSLSAIVPTQPPTGAPVVNVPTVAGAVPATAVPNTGAAAPTAAVVEAPTSAPPTETPVPECRAEDIQAWWQLQLDNYNTFTALTADTIRGEDNPAALLERLRLRREYSSAAAVPTLAEVCIAETRAALLTLFDAIMTWGRAIATAANPLSDPTTSRDALVAAESALIDARAGMTAALWEVGLLEEADSPAAEGVARGSGPACGFTGWLASVEPQYAQFKAYAVQIDVATLPASTVRELIGNMQAIQGNIAAVLVPDCAFTPSQLLQGAMAQQVTAFENQLAGRAQAGLDGLAEAARLETRFAAWAAWMG